MQFTQQVYRAEPAMDPQHYKTYGIHRPASHWNPATCEEVSCKHYLNGWKSEIDESTTDGKLQASTVRGLRSSYSFREEQGVGGVTVFFFEAGQRCFRAQHHRTPVFRPELYVVKRGDWRRSENVRTHRRAEDWVEDFAEHQDRLATRFQQG